MKNPRQLRRSILHASSPFDIRITLGRDAPESDVRSALATGEMGFLHSFTTGSTVDGPGVRLVAWTTGCQFRCLYCHNPDTWTLNNGVPVTLARAADELRKYQRGLRVMRGGFTLSGGEPLMQHRFAVKLFQAAQAMGVHTALDTNGALGERLTDAELETIDLVLLDIKSWDADRHLRLTGMDVAPTLDFARRLAIRRRPVWLRYVLTPGLTDDENDIAEIAKFTAGLGNVERVDVLPFHQLGRFKWKELELDYTLDHIVSPSRESVQRTIARFREVGLNAY
jgi:pyruvate formate lyase activating enzyme